MVVRYALFLLALALPNVVLGLHLLMSAFHEMARADGMGESMLAFIVCLVALGLELVALPIVWWAATTARRDRRGNRIRVALSAFLVTASVTPVALILHDVAR